MPKLRCQPLHSRGIDVQPRRCYNKNTISDTGRHADADGLKGLTGGAGRGKNGQGQQRRERRLTIDIRQIQGIYTPKTAWQKGMADRHPLLCVCSVFIGLVLRDGVQIRLYSFGFLGPLGLDSGRFTTPFLKCVSPNFSKKTNNPNPSPIKKIWFGLYLFGAGNRGRTCTPLSTRT